MRIAEIFRSPQGEGLLTGTDSVFVRTSGCNLRCRYCDTAYASWTPEGENLSVDEIVDQVDRLAKGRPINNFPFSCGRRLRRRQTCSNLLSPTESPLTVYFSVAPKPKAAEHVVITGGEPMLFAELIPLCAALHQTGKHITIETAGTLYLPVHCNLISISPKLSNSTPPADMALQWTRRHESNRHAPQVIRRLVAKHAYQLKFVVDCPDDCREVETYLAELHEIDRDRVMLMPQGIDSAELAEKAVWLEPYCTEHGLKFCPRRQIEWFGSVRGT